ncbi:MAG: RES family NAD+ phosphorylase [Sulfuricurvum sp.]
MNCCSNCFGDDFLADQIRNISREFGNCDYCKSEHIEIINPSELSDYFQPLIDLYDITESGKSLIDLLKKDWMLFHALEMDLAKQLLESILETKFDDAYAPKANADVGNILNWQDFKNELKYTNRYFPKKAPSYDHLNGLLQYLIVPKAMLPKQIYRARINEDGCPIDIDLMGKPPAKISTGGRANPVGIPYLYAASDTKTAIAEIRPHKGDHVTVAKFDILEPLKLADLRNPRQSISPFALDDNGLNQIFLDLDYLCHLGEELSKPILPREAHLEYLFSQYLCELIKHCGFDGVVYKSSVSDGDNFAIFYDEKLKASEIECCNVYNVSFDFK